MPYSIRYKEGEDRKALKDILFYVGCNNYKLLVRYLQKESLSEEQFALAISFAGVQGKPVGVMYRKYRK